ncbi:MAG: helix-turn-helix transcriptional regulator [Sedimentibacter sp.]|uniref:helix-turn-helix transcriptional regulator n=1 Tax=Sedimentibacter sp. TaxID=1960295 RepID=UPI002981C957|nr:helix-turn-helix transcriptional regulator [Sedimentibacter sp.]MDW5299309.1 helix-turn-helix transcriptional regulator [Sedimentibacter sp.]
MADTLSIKSVSKKNLPYFIGWIAIFIWLYSYFLPMGGFKFDSKLYYENVGYTSAYYYIFLAVGCIIPVFIDGRKFVPKTIYSVITAFICFIAIRFTGASILSKSLMIVASACIGHIFASNTFAFFMILNNAEKFYSMILAVLLPKVLMYVKPRLLEHSYIIDTPSLIIFSIMILLFVCSYFYKYNIEEIPVNNNIKAPRRAYSLMPLVFVIISLNDVVAPSTLRQIVNVSKDQIESFYFFGILIGIFIVIFFQKRFSINICNMLNISFAFLAMGFVVNIISIESREVMLISASCFGSSYAIGFVNIYYLAGFMTKKFQSIKFYKFGIILSTIYYIISFIIIGVSENVEMLPPPIFTALVSIFIVIIFFVLSPFFIKLLYSGEWIDDSYRFDVTKCSRLEAKLKDYKLTPAETEVCVLLLEGYTMRQIAGMQSKAYATINTYCTSIYRKLNINSRTELILILQDYISK